MSKYHYKNNMHIIDHIINELMIERTITETKEYKDAIGNVYLKMFPCVSEQAKYVEEMFDDYANDYTVKEWYESLFHHPIKNRNVKNVK